MLSEKTRAQFEELRRADIRRLGLLGGTFDPIHRGHMDLCAAAAQEFSLEKILLLVSGNPPHKNKVAPAKDRYEMARLAAQEHPLTQVSSLELERTGPIYTVDTLRLIKEQLPNTQLFFIIGMDTLLQLTSWRDFKDVFALTSFICFSRPGQDESEARYEMGLRLNKYTDRIFFARHRGLNVSSTEVRSRIAQGLPTADLLSAAAADYIRQKGLYQDAAPSLEQVSSALEAYLPPRRWKHTLGVIALAEELAEKNGVDVPSARWAALLHDCAKPLPEAEARELLRRKAPKDYNSLKNYPELLHAAAGPLIARAQYGMLDKEILSAIRYHTTGRRGMNKLEQIIYLADAAEEGRAYPSAERIRQLAREDFEAGLRLCMNLALQFILEKDQLMHPDSLDARNELLLRFHNTQRPEKI